MSHKKPKNTRPKELKDEVAKLKTQAISKDNSCQIDHNHDHFNCSYESIDNEPFSFAQNTKSTIETKKQNEQEQKKAAKNFIKPDFVSDVMKSFDNNFNFSSNFIAGNAETNKALTNLLQEIFVHTSSYWSNYLKENTEVGKDFLKCKDTNDMANFQSNLFTTNFSNMLDYSVKIGGLIQNFVVDHVNISNDLLRHNTKIVSNES